MQVETSRARRRNGVARFCVFARLDEMGVAALDRILRAFVVWTLIALDDASTANDQLNRQN